MKTLVTQLCAGRADVLARAISALERNVTWAGELLAAIQPHLGNARVIGLTGAPGVGKSTLTGALVAELRRRELSVGVIAVDPSSQRSGGALLGDRLRMTDHIGADPGVFVRSVASRGSLGGLAPVVSQAVDVMDAAGRDVIIIETVGVGQSETAIVEVADVNVLICAPGLGDEVQAQKAGVLEVVDLVLVNKADLPGASSYAERLALTLHGSGRELPVLLTDVLNGSGLAPCVDAMLKVAATATPEHRLLKRRRHLRRLLAEALAQRLLAEWNIGESDHLDRLCDAIRAGETTVPEALDQLIDQRRTQD